jgi:hypothetical protein
LPATFRYIDDVDAEMHQRDLERLQAEVNGLEQTLSVLAGLHAPDRLTDALAGQLTLDAG